MKRKITGRYSWWIAGIGALLLAAAAGLDVPERHVTLHQTGSVRP